MDSKQVYKAQFIEIFKRLSRDEFMEDPARILSFMMDFGFERQRVWMLKSVLALDLKDFKGFFECSPGSEDDAIDAIADYCYVTRDALSEIMHSMKGALSTDNVPTIIGEHRGEKCLVSDDGIAKYSLDLKTLLRVEDVDSFCIPDSVTSIGDWAFYCCSSLKEIIIPDSVTSIGDWAFYCCSSLKEVIIPDSVTSIGDWAFYCCSSLKEIIIPDSVTSIGDWAFSDCSSLKEVIIPDSVTAIGSGILSGDVQIHVTVSPCNEHYQSIDGCLYSKDGRELYVGYALVKRGMCRIPDSVTSIGYGAFADCSSLKEIVIPDSVTSIGGWAFFDCSSLKEIIIPDSVTSIGYRAFDGCSSLKEIVIPDSVTAIEYWAFNCCSSLKEIVIPDSVTAIGDWAFSGCSSLKVIEVPRSLKCDFKYIGSDAKIIRR